MITVIYSIFIIIIVTLYSDVVTEMKGKRAGVLGCAGEFGGKGWGFQMASVYPVLRERKV